MGDLRTHAAVLLALLVVAGPLAGCLGSSSSSQGPADSGASSDSESEAADDAGNASAPPSEDTANETAPDGNETDEPQTTWETTQNSTSITVQAANPNPGGNIPGVVVPPDEGRMTLIPDYPAPFTGILVEVTWSTDTDSTLLGDIGVHLESGSEDDEWMNSTRAGSGPIQMRIKPNDYHDGRLWVWAHAEHGDAALWLNAEVTAYATTFRGGPPNWNVSAIE